jgi:hypothetical protein
MRHKVTGLSKLDGAHQIFDQRTLSLLQVTLANCGEVCQLDRRYEPPPADERLPLLQCLRVSTTTKPYAKIIRHTIQM